MIKGRAIQVIPGILIVCLPLLFTLEALAETLAERNAALLKRVTEGLDLSSAQASSLKKVMEQSFAIGQGNPAVTVHPMSEATCREKVKDYGYLSPDPSHLAVCGKPFMVPLYDPEKTNASSATTCIDQFEFPGLPCTYPMVWTRADEAAAMCESIGKRLCDAHEWEGACAGALEDADYDFDAAKGLAPDKAVKAMARLHNRRVSGAKVWSYGSERRKGICAMNSTKSNGCNGGDWRKCGSNTYPTGAFPKCKSPLGVYDLHGNAAEHMNLPLSPQEMASAGSTTLGVTEMKGSWFIFDRYKAHSDHCRWRAPFWHGTKVRSKKSHHNYHLGFRCCSNRTLDSSSGQNTTKESNVTGSAPDQGIPISNNFSSPTSQALTAPIEVTQ